MKTTLDLPEDLILALKHRALRDRRKLKETVEQLLRQGLLESSAPKASSNRITKDKATGLPVVRCDRPSATAAELTPDQLHEILLNQEVERALDSSRH